ncbi:alpha-hydroxy acid oxidase [Labrys wisconsinensis]|uniref:4-hydroxymandelate oxidase n=1 Tax=Labrys wisconsinensis TaxID=425677 RepID=A0ABU0J0Z0_9HYPH|nr:alpha-hydroxy acid oxidase [Labrys wisconsinensis]MDQ0467221.1 4-hydroxymandelate oxidase [Labrys wisconsinensis]
MPSIATSTLPHGEEAREILGEALFAYLVGRARDLPPDAADANEQDLRSYRLLPRVMTGAAGISLATALCGRTLAAPLGVGAFAGDRVFHADGLLPIARACRRAGLPLVVSEETMTPLAAITAEHRDCWLQLRAAGPPNRIRRLVDEAAAAGAAGLVLTVLAPVHPAPGLQPGGYSIGADIARRGSTTIGSTDPGVEALPPFPAWSWSDLAAIAAHAGEAGLPLLAKGVLHPADAAAAERAGCAGVVVSNIGLRQSGRWATPASQLPSVRAASAGAVLLDGGVRHGVDAVVARCLGADLSLAVRPVVTALVAGGEAAVHDLLARWLDEIAAISSWCGVSSVTDLDGGFVLHGGVQP